MEFLPFPKTARLSRETIITEKLDGTNAQIYILPTAEVDAHDTTIAGNGGPVTSMAAPLIVAEVGLFCIFAGSRTKWITPGKTSDNYGFAAWVKANATELVKLGPGQHFGEWFGAGIQRTYGLGHKRFALFNSSRWVPMPRMHENLPDPSAALPGVWDAVAGTPGPECCYVVPTLWRGIFDLSGVMEAMMNLSRNGSAAVPGFHDPEGIVIFHTASGQMFKKTLVGDESPKGVPGLTNPRLLASGKRAADEVLNQKIKSNQ